MPPLELIDEIEQELGLATYVINWPIGTGDQFRGVFDRRHQQIHLFAKTAAHGSKKAADTTISLGDPRYEKPI
jgi:peptide chain release factor 3